MANDVEHMPAESRLAFAHVQQWKRESLGASALFPGTELHWLCSAAYPFRTAALGMISPRSNCEANFAI